MSQPRQICRCPRRIQRLCKRVKRGNRADVQDIIAALTLEADLKKNRHQAGKAQKFTKFSGAFRPPKWRSKKFRAKRHKDLVGSCIPMSPSMHLRLKYIQHCDREYPRPTTSTGYGAVSKKLYSELDLSDDMPGKRRRSVRYSDEVPCQISMPMPAGHVKHTDSDKSIFNVPSPKTSGENVAVRRASVKPQEMKPPLPAQSGHALFKPHSGIIINQEKDYIPETGPGISVNKPLPQKSKRKRKPPCARGGVCKSKGCKKKKCRKYQAMRRRQMALRARIGSRSGTECWTQSYARSLGARDGKPRTKNRKTFIPDDDDVCGQDEIQRPEHPKRPNLKKGSMKTHSLTVLPVSKSMRPSVRYGIITGSRNMYSDKFGGRSRGHQALTMSVMAYCLAFHYHPKQWTTKLIDNLMEAGDTWYEQCLDKQHDHSSIGGMCEVLPYGQKQKLLLNGKKMLVHFSEPEIIGYTMSVDPKVYNLYRGLIAFFMEHRCGMLLTRVLKLIIWKDKVCYYVFDPAGRNSKAFSDFANGSAALINVKDARTVAELLLGRSILNDQRYVLAPVKVLKMVDETDDKELESERELTQAEKAMLSYRILTYDSAVVNANMHYADKSFGGAAGRQALPIAVAALTYSKISPTNTWYSRTLDKILRLGTKLYRDFSNPKVMVDLTIDNVPNEIILGPYTCEIIIYRDRVKGQLFTTKKCLLNLKTGLADFFSRQYNSGLLEFNNNTFAVWKQKDMFYIFDPLPRTGGGQKTSREGKACCLMLLNTDAMADAITKNWDFLPPTTQFYIHAFKVLKMQPKKDKRQIKCTLSDEELHASKKKSSHRKLKPGTIIGEGEGRSLTVMPMQVLMGKQSTATIPFDEEKMGDIISLIDSIQDDYVPTTFPPRGKRAVGGGGGGGGGGAGGFGGGRGGGEWGGGGGGHGGSNRGRGGGEGGTTDGGSEASVPQKRKLVNLDSPTVSVTQVVPPYPKPRDKTNEPPDRDPDPEPTPPPTPPVLPPPEGGAEEAAEEEEDLDDEALALKREEEKRRKKEEEEARNKVDLPPPMPPPPPSPQEEIPLAPCTPPGSEDEGEMEALQAVAVERNVLLAEDARRRFKLRQIRKKMTTPLTEVPAVQETPSQELDKEHNFYDLPDRSQIIRGKTAIPESDAINVLPFTSIMAIVTSYKYAINTWTEGIVDFVIDTAKKLHSKKKERFQLAPLHIIPKIGIGSQAFAANIDVVGEGATWQLEDVLNSKFFTKYDRGMLTTPNYSCAFFKRNGLYYLFDGSTCNPMGLREAKASDSKDKSDKASKDGKACFLRFRSLHDMAARILHNKDGKVDDQQFILSRVLVRRLLPEQRYKLPEDYDYVLGRPTGKKSKMTLAEPKDKKDKKAEPPPPSEPEKPGRDMGYKNVNGVYRIEGTTALSVSTKKSPDVKPCHFVSLVAMLMATMHPLKTWDQVMVDTCIEKGLEIYQKAANKCTCEKRAIRNIILDGKFINVNIKKIIVVNENPTKTIEQYMKAVLNRLRYVIVKFPQASMVICQADGFYHLFDPYAPPSNEPIITQTDTDTDTDDDRKKRKKSKEEAQKDKKRKGSETSATSASEDDGAKGRKAEAKKKGKPPPGVAGWTLYRDIDALLDRICLTITSDLDEPEFYTFELTSVKNAPRRSALLYKLSPMFKPETNPNEPYIVRKRPRPLVQEKMYWLNADTIPWSRMNSTNDAGIPRNTARTLWKDWDIEIPGDLFSLWGSIHPTNAQFDKEDRGKQVLACCVVALALTRACDLTAWTGSFLDGIVINGNSYHKKLVAKIGNEPNHEVALEDFDSLQGDMYPYTFDAKSEKVIFGFVYNLNPDCFNLSQALSFFFQKYDRGILTCPTKNLAFGKNGTTYFMFDCQSNGLPIFCPGKSSAYILRCMSLNRLIYVMTITLNVRAHNQQFHLYSMNIKLSEKSKPAPKEGEKKPETKPETEPKQGILSPEKSKSEPKK